MRDILFRGKTKQGKWVYGSLILAGTYCCILESEEDAHPMDYPYLDDDIGTIDGKATPVIPETVGQYTGFEDKNGKKIFEGDIVDAGEEDWDRFFENSTITVVYEHLTGGFDPFASYDCDCGIIIRSNKCVIIGNIYDNPELLIKEGE